MTAKINYQDPEKYPKRIEADDVHEVDLDYRSNFNEEDDSRPSYLRNKPTGVMNIPDLPVPLDTARYYALQVGPDGVYSWVDITE